MSTASTSGAASPALARARAAMLAEATRPRSPSWKSSLALVAGVSASLVGAIAVTGLAVGQFSTEVVGLHVHAMVLLAGTAAVLWLSAFVPARRPLRVAAIVAGLLAMAMLVWLRTDLGQPDTSRLTCTISHLGVAVLPAAVTLNALRRAAFSPLRAFAAGLGVGAMGAFAGEVGCRLGPLHVLMYHLPAWVICTLSLAYISSRVKPRSYAP